MKKTILVALIAVMVSTPCFAQEVETDGMFSIEGTKWETLISFSLFPFPWPMPKFSIGFWGGGVYVTPYLNTEITESFYVDMLGASIFMYKKESSPLRVRETEIGFGIIQSIGVGFFTWYWHSWGSGFPKNILVMALIIRTNDNWTPDH